MELEIMDKDASVDSEIVARPHLLQVARVLRDQLDADLEAQHSGNDRVSREKLVGIKREGLKRVEVKGQQTACSEHLCSESEDELINRPDLWGALPKELLQLVFARLPMPEIMRLRCLSKEWKRDINTTGSEFSQACEEASGSTFALVCPDHHGCLWVRFFDMKINRWHAFRIYDQDEEPLVTVTGGDGGLLCFISKSSKHETNPLCITVLNPLTGELNELPVLDHLSAFEPTMVQLYVDRQGAKHYKVIAVDNRTHRFGCVAADVYDSKTRQWMKAEKSSDLVLGYTYQWKKHDDGRSDQMQISGPWAYDFAEGRLHGFIDEDNGWQGPCVISYAFLNDRLFVLHEDMRAYEDDLGSELEFPASAHCISEYHAPKRSGFNWVKVDTHRCTPFDRVPTSEHLYSLYACRSFLMVCTTNIEPLTFNHQYAWLYDLRTREWCDLPPLEDDEVDEVIDEYDIMCELQWNVVA